MIYTTKCCKNEGRAWRALASLALVTLLGGCATPVARFHAYEGGVIAQHPPPPPGLHQPFPNLAAVPARPAAISAVTQRQIRAALQAENIKQNHIPAPGEAVSPPAKITLAAAPTPPVLLGFAPGSAILTPQQNQIIAAFAAKRGPAMIRAAGFATARTGAGLRLALLRATAIANALTAAGVPGAQIRIAALTGAHGGAAQFLLPPPTTRAKD
ncbi:MAG TPA: hypothetical protein PK677_11980 [Acidiphilium sp.]|nr:MAG: hypothetical protein B7Z67_10480 [Acidiphilium sp. 21-60-14]OYV90057.1 MAG: hypothetical protein B7Z57_10270 [Acidiphilium sp. 37-60-79]OZB40391.1 MAG: hypothetical protein B7X48_05105 [Acidiphilium sp. 34-60-192]HQT89255.1 hypothetical protein [Acidiphilium sp.]HQU24938.1 hypothetical protein [Acidiphilium sp.]